MNNILDDLYLGNINPSENMRIRDLDYRILFEKSVELEDELGSLLNEKERKLFECFVDAMGNMHAIEVRLRFAEGIRLGAKIILDVFYK